MPDIINLATNVTLNAKINEIKNKISNITKLVITNAVAAVENEIAENITTRKSNKLTPKDFTTTLAQVNLTSK